MLDESHAIRMTVSSRQLSGIFTFCQI